MFFNNTAINIDVKLILLKLEGASAQRFAFDPEYSTACSQSKEKGRNSYKLQKTQDRTTINMYMRRLIFIASYHHWCLIKMSQKIIASFGEKK